MYYHSEYHPFANGKEIKFNIRWDKDVGYRVTVLPVKRTRKDGYSIEESGAFTGFNDTLLFCERRSKSNLEKAKSQLKLNTKKYLDYFEADRVKETIIEAQNKIKKDEIDLIAESESEDEAHRAFYSQNL